MLDVSVHLCIHSHVDFEWDPAKAKANFTKHGIPLADAVKRAEDDLALTILDPYSEEEERRITLGVDSLGRLLVVVYIWRREGIRLISTRLATEGKEPIRTKMRKPMKDKYDFSKAKRGSVVPVPKGKTRITIRLDDDILDWFREQVNRAGGGNYQSLINHALHANTSRTTP